MALSRARIWFLAARPWAFTASAIPVCVGAGLGAVAGSWSFWRFCVTLLGTIALQSGTNFHNTYGDYMSGVDTPESAKTCPQLLDGTIKPEAMRKAGWFAFGFAILLSLPLAFSIGPGVFIFAITGVVGGYYYTMSRSPYKYSGKGVYCVFFLMGPLIVLPAYYIQTGFFAVSPILASLPIGCMVAAILHANDIRDIGHDTAAGINTIALQAGHATALTLYTVLNVAAYAFLLLAVLSSSLPLPCLLAFTLAPLIHKKLRLFQENVADIEAEAAKFHFLFGTLIILGIVISIIYRHFQSSI